MFSKNKDLKIQQLEQRALKSYKLNEVYKKDINSKKILSFLKSQQSIPFYKIEKILSSTVDENFPVGVIMVDLKFNKIVGFVGTFFSKRSISGKDQFFCNIHSWIVNTQHRLYSFFLISDLIKKKLI